MIHVHAVLPFEPQHDKSNKMTCAQRRLRSACASALSDQNLCCALYEKLRTECFFKRTAKTDQTGQMSLRWMHRSLFCVFFYRAAAHLLS